ncbi:replication initiator protein [Capybara microvirus Cap1_SP_240]|nr:replication initiator protein [Capybara microvirus Cap1_SP_240]
MCINPKRVKIKNPCHFNGALNEFFREPFIIRYVPCKRCVECQINESKEWALRMSLEADKYQDCCFLTLTYDDDNNPRSLNKTDYQKFLKRLRKHISPTKIKYFLSAEYGGKTFRPHYHLIIFGWKPEDAFPLKVDEKGNQLYYSPTVAKLWLYGFHSVGEPTQQSMLYCAKYLQKLQSVPDGFVKPFVAMSKMDGPLGYPGQLSEGQSTYDRLSYAGKIEYVPQSFWRRAVKDDELIRLDRALAVERRLRSFKIPDLESVERRKQRILENLHLGLDKQKNIDYNKIEVKRAHVRRVNARMRVRTRKAMIDYQLSMREVYDYDKIF